ncbi:MAG: hypothetical protein RL688_1869 [Actinomycetota bacterium]
MGMNTPTSETIVEKAPDESAEMMLNGTAMKKSKMPSQTWAPTRAQNPANDSGIRAAS